MKNKRFLGVSILGFILVLGCLTVLFGCAGCASSHKHGRSEHTLRQFVTVAPGAVISVDGSVTLVPSNGVTRAHNFLAREESWTDAHSGGGIALLADPKVSAISSTYTNQSALGGSSEFTVGSVESTVSTNAAQIIGAGGSAIGNVIKEATGKP